MIRLNTLEIFNFAGIRHQMLDFADGINVLTGPNGSGKSTCLGALRFALTGQMATRLEDLVRDGTARDEEAGVELTFTAHDRTGRLRRLLQPERGRHRLVLGEPDAGTVLTREGDIARQLEALLGASRWTVDTLLLVDQLELASVLSAQRGDVAKGLARLFGVERIERLWGALGEHLNRLPPLTVVDEGVIERFLQEAGAEFEAVKQQLEGLPAADADAYHARERELRDRLAMRLRQDLLDRRVREEKAALEGLRRQAGAAHDNVREEGKKGDEFATEVMALEAQAGAARQAKADWDRYRQAAADRQHWTDEVAAAARHRETVEADKPRKLTKKQQWTEEDRQQLEDLYGQVGSLRRLTEGVSDAEAGLDRCPYCGTEVKGMGRKRRQAARDLAKAKLKIAELTLKQSTFLTNQEDWRRWQKDADAAAARYERAVLMVVVPPLPEPALTLEQAEAVLKDLVRVGHALADSRRRLLQHDRDQARLDAAVDKELQTLQALQDERSRLDEPEAAAYLDGLQEELQASWMKATRLQAQLDAKAGRVRELLTQLEAARAANAAQQREQNVRTTLQQLRDVFHKDRLMRSVLQQLVRGLDEDTRQRLADLEAPFTVAFEEDLSITVRKDDGAVHDASLLSVGQKDLLALSFRCALSALLAADLGFFCLDEPMANLDVANRLRFCTVVLDWLRGLSSERGLQVILTAHDLPASARSGCRIHTLG